MLEVTNTAGLYFIVYSVWSDSMTVNFILKQMFRQDTNQYYQISLVHCISFFQIISVFMIIGLLLTHISSTKWPLFPFAYLWVGVFPSQLNFILILHTIPFLLFSLFLQFFTRQVGYILVH